MSTPSRSPGGRELGERAREEVVAARFRRDLAVLVPGRRAASPELRAVDQVVVHERRDMRELDGDAAAKRVLPLRRRQMDEQRPQTFSARLDRGAAHSGDEPRVALDRDLETLLELVEERPRFLEDGLGAHSGRTAVCSATLPPPSRR